MMQHSRRLKAAILLVLLCPAAAPAQHHDMGRLWDSLTARADPQALEALAHSPDTAAAHPAAASLVKQGLVALRRFQLTGSQRDAAAARAAFEEATRRHPGFAWAFFGLGLTFVQAPLLRSPGMSAVGGGIGLDAGTLARNAFSRALELDPSFVQPARALAELALETREPEDLRRGRDALEGVLATGRGHTELWLMRAELEIALGRAGAALAAADSALRAGGDVALGLRARAAALFAEAGADSAGAATYLAGLEHLTPSAAERYFDDVALIATPAETRAWGAADLAGRGAWLRRFWEERAARDGITVAQRVATHYHRLAKALSDFHWRWLEDATPPGALLRETLARRPLDVDDRGVVRVRHGEPDKVVRTHLPYVQPNETWVYFRPGADLLFTFAQLRQASGWRLVDDILALVEWDAHVHERAAKSFLTLRFLSDSALGQLQQLGFFEYAQELLQELAPYEPGYGQILGRLHMVDIGNPRSALSEATMPYLEVGARLRERALAALATDADWPRFERELPFHYDLFTFRGADGRTDLLAALAVPGERLEAAGEEGRAKKALYVLRTRLIVLDTARGRVARRDTVQVFQAAAPLQPGEYLRAHLTLEVSPAESALHRVVVEGSDPPPMGQLYGGPLRVPDYSGDRLMLSDLVLAEADREGVWRRGGVSLSIVPPGQFRSPGVFRLFYEIYNLPPGVPYRTEIEVKPAAGRSLLARLRSLLGGKERIELRFEGVATSGPDNLLQEVRRVAAEFRPGRYRLRLRITNLSTQEAAVRDRLFDVLPSAERLR